MCAGKVKNILKAYQELNLVPQELSSERCDIRSFKNKKVLPKADNFDYELFSVENQNPV